MTADFSISLLLAYTKIQYLLYSNCSKCPPPVAMQFSDTGVLGYIGILELKEHSPEVWHIPPGIPCIYVTRN